MVRCLILIAEANSTVPSVFQRLSDLQRTSVMSGFAVIATVTAFLILFILSFGRIVRWYMHRHPRATQVLGDPLAQVIDSKPRVSKHESMQWRRRS